MVSLDKMIAFGYKVFTWFGVQAESKAEQEIYGFVFLFIAAYACFLVLLFLDSWWLRRSSDKKRKEEERGYKPIK